MAGPDTSARTDPGVSATAHSEKRVLPTDPARDATILVLTGNDSLATEILDRHSLIVGSKITMKARRDVYAWLVDHIRVSAALTRILGRKYQVSTGSLYEYHGEEGDDLSVEFFRAYRDSSSTIYIGTGDVKIFHIPVSGSFINYLEYYNVDGTRMVAQNCMYIMLNNRIKRFFANILLAVSDIETGLMEKLFSLDDTVFGLVHIFMEDPHLHHMLSHPEAPAPEGASEVAKRVRNTVVRESSREEARKLGQLIGKARLGVGY